MPTSRRLKRLEDLAVIKGYVALLDQDKLGLGAVTVAGKKLGALGDGEWAMPKLTSLLKATASGST